MKWSVFIASVLLGAAAGQWSSVGTSQGLPEEIRFQVYVAYDNVFHYNFSDEHLAKKYAVVFFNAINLIFQNMTNPRIKFEVVMFHTQTAQFTFPALTLDNNEVDAHESLISIEKFISTRPQFSASDILFVFCGRKVFTKSQEGKKVYSPQGLTWERGICNRSRKIVIVNDMAKNFYALPNAAFQLARLLGAPTACTPGYSELEGHFKLFHLSNCAAGNISKFLKELQQKYPHQARDCFRQKYNSAKSLSSFYKDLPNKIANEDVFCKKLGELRKEYPNRGICYRHGIISDLHEIYTNPAIKSSMTSENTQCVFDCCSIDYSGQPAFQFHSHYAFDGTPCRPTHEGKICILGRCVGKNFTS
ncbi:uncharacterized protein LOC135374260 [Ornithodoros turicata]|uniref:uncharacterized protein LOC135374260 n=1 Tax=Ornithodoros turicata TaxID=34597 RepID=UPI003139676B